MQVVLQDEDISSPAAGEYARKMGYRRWLVLMGSVPNGPGLSCQGWLVMLPTACLSGRFRDRPLTCDASTTKAAPLMQELGIGRRLASNRSLREELRTPQQATNREFK